MALIESLESAWYGSRRIPWWTWPLAALYGAVIRLRRGLYHAGWLRSVRLPAPVIVIGNLSVGGTGKTPLTIAVVAALSARGYRPGVVSRGYGGSQLEPLLLEESPLPSQVGDEPCLIRSSGVAVAVGRDRPAAAKLLLDAGCDVVIADDGLQHYALQRDLEICVIDGIRRFGNQHLLPAGPLREPMSRLQMIDLRVCNGGAVGEGEYPMQLEGGEIVSLIDSERRSLADFAGRRIHAVAAIGNPQRFFNSLRASGLTPVEHAFDDHHQFVAGDLAFAEDLPIFMTDKDGVKCVHFAKKNWWRVPVHAVLPEAFFDELDKRLSEAVSARR